MATDDDVELLRDLLLPALVAELSRDSAVADAQSSAERRLRLLRDLADPELDEQDEQQALVGWLSGAISD
jgi:hypothetical protein